MRSDVYLLARNDATPILVLIGISIFCIYLFRFQQTVRLNGIYLRVAQRFRGLFFRGRFFSLPSVRFTHRHAHVLLDVYVGALRWQKQTQFHISWPDHDVQAEIQSWDRISWLKRLTGPRRVRIGSPGFERDFRILSNNPDAIREFLSGGVQFIFGRLRRIIPGRGVHVILHDGILTVRLRGEIKDIQALVKLVSLGLEMFDQAMLTRTAGIEILDTSSTQGDEQAVCRVCGDRIKPSERVECRRCQTPHHKDCWSYFGACSTYGCGETKYQRK